MCIEIYTYVILSLKYKTLVYWFYIMFFEMPRRYNYIYNIFIHPKSQENPSSKNCISVVKFNYKDAYFISNSSYKTCSEILIQRFSRFTLSPIGWLMSRNNCCSLAIGLYTILAPFSQNLIKTLQGKQSRLAKIFVDTGMKISINKCCDINQQTPIK